MKYFLQFLFSRFEMNRPSNSVGMNYCGFYFCDSVYSPRNRENKNPAKISRYTVFDHWGGGGSDVVSLIYCFGKGGGYFKLLYNYMKMIFLQNCMEKLINDIITLFLFNILKLLCSYFVHLSYFPTSTSVLNCLVSHIWEQLYINLRKMIGFNIFLF